MISKFILPLPVSINQLYINQYTWNDKLRQMIPSGKRILSKEGEIVKKAIIKFAKKQIIGQNWNYSYTKDHFIYMDVIIFFNRRGRDDTNLYKLLCDSLEKIVYENDSRVLVRTQRIYYDKKNPRVEVSFTPVEYIGIFDDKEQLDKFENNCKNCSRYNRNCSLLQNAKDGFIQEEIENFICSSFKQKKN